MSRRSIDHLSDGTMIVWAACECMVWPVAPPALMGVGRCGRCGVRAEAPMAKPKGGRARPLTEREREEAQDYRDNYGD